MTAEAQVGSVVWERADEAADHARRGGTVVAFHPDQDGFPSVLIADVRRSVARGRESFYLRTFWLPLESIDPSLTAAAQDRRAEACRLGRHILRAVSHRSGQPGPRDWAALRYVVGLWCPDGNPGIIPEAHPTQEGD